MLLLRDLVHSHVTLYSTVFPPKTKQHRDKSLMAVTFRGGNQYMSDELAGFVSLFYQFEKVILTFVVVVQIC